MSKHKFPYCWHLSDGYPAKGIEPNNLNVFGTFICGGGSTMGYKLAGFNHLGGVEIDKKVAEVYKTNHHPKHLYVEDLRAFNQRNDLSIELYNLDILDGSPPCSTFSTVGNGEKDWGKEKMFREGQSKQVLDDLIFVYAETIIKLKPKVAILENVKGLIQVNAKAYLHKVTSQLRMAGYSTQVFLLNAASMGVPQKRERIFLIARQANLGWQDIQLKFNEKAILYSDLKDNGIAYREFTEHDRNVWQNRRKGDKDFGDTLVRMKGKNTNFSSCYIYDNITHPTIVSADGSKYIRFDEDQYITETELLKIGSYPIDYNFMDMKPKYLIGMSVPPVMTAQIAHQIYLQWFKNDITNA